MILRAIYILLGTISLGLGILGIFVPGLPTTPFLLLTAGLYVKSSKRLYLLLISNKHVGPYIVEFRTNKGLTLKAKLYAIAMMWTMILLSAGFLIHPVAVKLVVLGVGLVGTIVMGFAVPTIGNKNL
jgi:uncharacterized protein